MAPLMVLAMTPSIREALAMFHRHRRPWRCPRALAWQHDGYAGWAAHVFSFSFLSLLLLWSRVTQQLLMTRSLQPRSSSLSLLRALDEGALERVQKVRRRGCVYVASHLAA